MSPASNAAGISNKHRCITNGISRWPMMTAPRSFNPYAHAESANTNVQVMVHRLSLQLARSTSA
jgi:hypothetical protein